MQVADHLPHPPTRTQRRRVPLGSLEGLQTVDQRQALGRDGPEHLVVGHLQNVDRAPQETGPMRPRTMGGGSSRAQPRPARKDSARAPGSARA